MGALIDMTGRVFGRLTVIRRAETNSNSGKSQWVCVCVCGSSKEVIGGNLQSGQSTSCGCYSLEVVVQRSYKHGGSPRKSPPPEYGIWNSMVARTTCATNKSYQWYGARGIKVCPRWLESYKNFRDDMGPKPPQHSLDRTDNSKVYSPENCRWVSAKTQARNRSNTLHITHEGVTLPLAEWAEIKGLRYQTLYERLNTHNYTIAEALETPVGGKRKP